MVYKIIRQYGNMTETTKFKLFYENFLPSNNLFYFIIPGWANNMTFDTIFHSIVDSDFALTYCTNSFPLINEPSCEKNLDHKPTRI